MRSINKETREQAAKILLLVMIVANAGLFLWLQLDRYAIGEAQRRVAELAAEAAAPRGPSSMTVVRQGFEETGRQVVEASEVFPKRIDTTAMRDHIVQSAGQLGVRLTGLTLLPLEIRTLAGGKYAVVRMTVQGTGDLPNLYGFLDRANNKLYSTSTLEKIRFVEDAGVWSLQFDVVVIGRPQ